MGAEYKVDKAVTLTDFLDIALFLDHAAAHGNLHAGSVLFEMTGTAQPAEHTLVGVVADGAGVVDQKIGVFGFCFRKACTLKDSDDLLRVARIHLASEGLHTESQRPPFFLDALLSDHPGACQKPCLSGRFIFRCGAV